MFSYPICFCLQLFWIGMNVFSIGQKAISYIDKYFFKIFVSEYVILGKIAVSNAHIDYEFSDHVKFYQKNTMYRQHFHIIGTAIYYTFT